MAHEWLLVWPTTNPSRPSRRREHSSSFVKLLTGGHGYELLFGSGNPASQMSNPAHHFSNYHTTCVVQPQKAGTGHPILEVCLYLQHRPKHDREGGAAKTRCTSAPQEGPRQPASQVPRGPCRLLTRCRRSGAGDLGAALNPSSQGHAWRSAQRRRNSFLTS